MNGRKFVRLMSLVATLAMAGVVGAPSESGARSPAGNAQRASADCGAPRGAPDKASWVAAWALPTNDAAEGYEQQSVRVVVTPNFSGRRTRVRLSNALGERPVTLSQVHVGRVESGARLVPGTNKPLFFRGSSTVTIPAGATVRSDRATMRVRAFKPLAVSYFAPRATGPATGHGALATTYVADGAHADDSSSAAYGSGVTGGRFVSAVDVFAPNDGAIVALGDSITQGFSSDRPIVGEARWTDTLAQRLHRWARDGGPKLSIVNVGISGNRVRKDGTGPSAAKRLRRDVLTQSGLRGVIMMEGINDLAYPFRQETQLVSLGAMVKAYKSIIRRIRGAGASMWLSALTPAGDTRRPTPFTHSLTPEQIERRHEINRWIRARSGVYDGRIDFEPVVKDPQNPNWLRLEYDSGDNLHPNNAGYVAMGKSIRLRAIRDAVCR